jgi:hypothetical protein
MDGPMLLAATMIIQTTGVIITTQALRPELIPAVVRRSSYLVLLVVLGFIALLAQSALATPR